jgi:hypothetical protein
MFSLIVNIYQSLPDLAQNAKGSQPAVYPADVSCLAVDLSGQDEAILSLII